MFEPVIAAPRSISILFAASILLATGGFAVAQELPSYEAGGFPITPLQMTVLNTDRIEERSPTSIPRMNGMPASPSQVAILGGGAARARAGRDIATGAIGVRLVPVARHTQALDSTETP